MRPSARKCFLCMEYLRISVNAGKVDWQGAEAATLCKYKRKTKCWRSCGKAFVLALDAGCYVSSRFRHGQLGRSENAINEMEQDWVGAQAHICTRNGVVLSLTLSSEGPLFRMSQKRNAPRMGRRDAWDPERHDCLLSIEGSDEGGGLVLGSLRFVGPSELRGSKTYKNYEVLKNGWARETFELSGSSCGSSITKAFQHRSEDLSTAKFENAMRKKTMVVEWKPWQGGSKQIEAASKYVIHPQTLLEPEFECTSANEVPVG
ncbi:hypothetical protein BD779DRAFT_1478377 [Infundibulicybe gibba]|nr:hypothetical protein BD779DRAFT_1478377 [Infundibulicybe gibba]